MEIKPVSTGPMGNANPKPRSNPIVKVKDAFDKAKPPPETPASSAQTAPGRSEEDHRVAAHDYLQSFYREHRTLLDSIPKAYARTLRSAQEGDLQGAEQGLDKALNLTNRLKGITRDARELLQSSGEAVADSSQAVHYPKMDALLGLENVLAVAATVPNLHLGVYFRTAAKLTPEQKDASLAELKQSTDKLVGIYGRLHALGNGPEHLSDFLVSEVAPFSVDRKA
ncbi:MAG: hypothetical protein V1728_01425 [Candidatus Micrarchaeota archaeon]